jgi:hypothetical protein
VGPEELVGTIEEVEPHDNDAKPPEDPWQRAQGEIGQLGRRIKDTYHAVADESGPSEDEIRDAFGTLLNAWNQVAGTVGVALQDPDVREHLRSAASALANALGATISGLGAELRAEEE